MTEKETAKNALKCHDRLNKISSSVFDPKSGINIDALLDCMSSVAYELDQKAATNSKTLSVVLDRIKQSCKLIQSSRVNISDFSILKVLGKGAFGKVSLVRHNETNKIYALKAMNKYEMVKRDEALCLWEEREIMALSNSDFLVRMYYAFQDEVNIYMVMEFVQGGDMVHYMNNSDIDEDSAKFYLAELSLALDFLHELGFIHRDVKPDNMLLDQGGHLKLCDFGTCIKMNEFGKVACAIAVGTPDYIAPEVLNSQNNKMEYGREVDWWSAGIFLYEFLVGDTPFYAESYVGTYMNILNYKKTLKFPSDIEISEEAKSMISSFLNDTEIRLGYNGIDSVKAHQFFKGVSWSWDTIRNCPPPVVPQFAGESDASYFESNVDDGKLDDQTFSKPPVGGYHYPFIGFSFNPDFVSTFGAPALSPKSHVDDHTVDDLKKRLADKMTVSGNVAELLESKSQTLLTANAKIEEYTHALNVTKEEQIKSHAKIKDLENKLDTSIQGMKKMEVQLKFIKISENETKMRYEELIDQVGPLKQSLDIYKTQQANLEATLSDLTQQLSHSKSCYNEAISDYQKLNNTHQALLQEVDSIQLYFACNTLEKLKVMVETTQNKNREMCAKLKHAEEEIKTYEEMFKNKSTVEDSTRVELTSRNKKLLLDVATLQMLSDSLRAQIADLNSKNSDLLHSLTMSQQENKETHMRLNEINSKLLASTHLESRLNIDKKLLVEKEHQLQTKLDKSLELLRSFEKRITSFDEQLSYAEIKVNTQAKKIEHLEEDMSRREQNIVSLNKDIEILQKQNIDNVQLISTQTAEISDSKCSIEKLEAQLALLSIDYKESLSANNTVVLKLSQEEKYAIQAAEIENGDVKTQYTLLKQQFEEERAKFEKVIETERTLKAEAIRKLNEVLSPGSIQKRLVSTKTQKNQPIRIDRKLEQTYKQLQMDYNKISDENAEMKKKYDTKISELNTFILDLQSTIERMKMERMDEDRLRSQNYEMLKSSKGSDIDKLSKADQLYEIKRAVLSYPTKSGKTGRKVNWSHVMAVLTNQELTIYSDLEEVQKPLFVINISMMYYVRAISHNDLIRGLPADIPKIFQIIYNEDSDSSLQSSSDISNDKCIIINNHHLINIQYHMPATCDICGKGLWGFIKTSFAMECKNCHFKCHREHAAETKAFPPCRDYENRRMAKEILLKANSVSEQKYWIETLLRLMKTISSGAPKKSISKPSTGSSNQSLQDIRSPK